MVNKELEQIVEAKVKELSKLSTAPDKETPDWMESDIRRGILAGIEIAGATSSSTVKNLEREVERLKTQIIGLKVSNEELQHYKDTTLGLWATDKPEAIEDPLGILFQLTENNL